MLRATFFALMLLLSGTAQAQMTAVTGSEDAAEASRSAAEILRSDDTELTEALIRDLVARLSDEEVRGLLLDRLDRTAQEAQEGVAGGRGAIHDSQLFIQQMRARLISFGLAVPRIPSELSAAVGVFLDGRPASILWLVLFGFTLMIVVGAAFEWIFMRLTHKVQARILNAEPRRPIAKLFFPAARLFINFTGLLIFLVGVIITFFIMYQGHELTRATVMTYVGVIGIARAISMIFECVLAPKAPNLRLSLIPRGTSGMK